jgi:iron complex transport system ATP-binding protein
LLDAAKTESLALSFEDVSFEVHGRRVLDRIALSVAAREFMALVGPNGAGKSTLLRTALGLVRRHVGVVRLGGRALGELRAVDRAALVAWLPQQLALTESVSVEELVATARFRFREGHDVAIEQARIALEQAGAAAFAARSVLELSGGERQRVLIAALLAQRAPLLLLDEPANHLDPAQQIELYRLLGRLWQSGLTLVCVSHDVNLLRHLPDPARVRVCGMDAGRLCFDLPYTAAELPGRLSELYGLELRALDVEGGRVLVAGAGTEP